MSILSKNHASWKVKDPLTEILTPIINIRSEKESDNISTNDVTVLEPTKGSQPMKRLDLASSVQREE